MIQVKDWLLFMSLRINAALRIACLDKLVKTGYSQKYQQHQMNDCFATDLLSLGGEELRQMCKGVYLQHFALKLMNELNWVESAPVCHSSERIMSWIVDLNANIIWNRESSLFWAPRKYESSWIESSQSSCESKWAMNRKSGEFVHLCSKSNHQLLDVNGKI